MLTVTSRGVASGHAPDSRFGTVRPAHGFWFSEAGQAPQPWAGVAMLAEWSTVGWQQAGGGVAARGPGALFHSGDEVQHRLIEEGRLL
jgi:hypothetical protein